MADRDPLAGVSMRVSPRNLEAEQALLGAILANNRAFDRVGNLLPEHFADPINGEIFRAIKLRIERGILVDAVTLATVFGNNMLLDEVGGARKYLSDLLVAMVGIINAGEYANAIRDTWLRRQLIEAGSRLIEGAFGGAGDVDGVGVAALAMTEIADVVGRGTPQNGLKLSQAVQDALQRSDEASRGVKGAEGLQTGIRAVDAIWGGLHRASLDIIGGRTREGKTAFALQVCRNVARECQERGEGCVAIVSLEMSATDLGTVNLASMSGVPADVIRRGVREPLQAEALLFANRKLRLLPIEIVDRPRMPLSEIAAWLRDLKRRRGLRLAVVDHRDLVGRESGRSGAGMQRQEFAPFVSASMKELAKSLDIAILLLVQVSRGVEAREDSRPKLSDLMFGSEQDADNVLFVYRPEVHLERRPERGTYEKEDKFNQRFNEWWTAKEAVKGKASILFEKRRFGDAGEAKLLFHGPSTTFRDLAEPAAEEEEIPF